MSSTATAKSCPHASSRWLSGWAAAGIAAAATFCGLTLAHKIRAARRRRCDHRDDRERAHPARHRHFDDWKAEHCGGRVARDCGKVCGRTASDPAAAAAKAKALADFEARPVHEGKEIESMSTIVLLDEAHRRGWKSKTLHFPLKVTLLYARLPDDTIEEIIIRNSRCEAINGVGALVADDKHFTLSMAQHYGMPMPVTKLLRASAPLSEALAFLAEHKLVVVKPLDQGHGDGVTAWIADESQLTAALATARTFSADVLLQRHHREPDHRLLIVGYKLVAAVKRVPAYVTGDGMHTIDQLLATKNADPRRGPGHTSLLSTIPIEDVRVFLGADRMADVPAKGQVVTCLSAANVSRGGESHDITDIVHPSIAELCTKFARVAGMGVCGCDVLCSDISKPASESKPVFLELNAGPGLRLHTYPNVGQPRNVSAVILDYLVAKRLHERTFAYRVQPAGLPPPAVLAKAAEGAATATAAATAAATATAAAPAAGDQKDAKHGGK